MYFCDISIFYSSCLTARHLSRLADAGSSVGARISEKTFLGLQASLKRSKKNLDVLQSEIAAFLLFFLRRYFFTAKCLVTGTSLPKTKSLIYDA